jgi:hypothetical protein
MAATLPITGSYVFHYTDGFTGGEMLLHQPGVAVKND